jgi:SelR domain
MENKTSPQIEETLRQSVEEVRQPSRRTFLTLTFAASGAAALWYLPKPFASASAVERSADAPSTVTVVKFSSAGKNLGKEAVPHIVKSDAEWKSQLSPISYQVARQAGTERPYTGDTWDLHTARLFRCVCCDTALFSSETKFDSGTGCLVSGRYLQRRTWSRSETRRSAWSEPRYRAVNVTLILATSSTMVLNRPVYATA